MADEQNVKITLESKADTSGFDRFKQSHQELTSARERGRQANEGFLESERRVRTNLEETIKGLVDAKSPADALASSIGHLSEVFAIGFSASVIAGVGSQLIESFSKSQEEVKKLTQDLENAKDAAEALGREISGKKLSETDQLETKLAAQQKALDQKQEEENSVGLGTGLARSLGDLLNGNFGRDSSSARIQRQINEAQNQLAVDKGELAARRRREDSESEKHIFDSNLNFGTNPEQIFEAHEKAREIQAKFQEDEQKRHQKAAAEAAEAAKKQAHSDAEKAKAAAKAEAKSENEPTAQITGYRVKLESKAGAQREVGGGGRAYSTITIDPVVTEARKQTGLLTQIEASLREQLRKPVSFAAAA